MKDESSADPKPNSSESPAAGADPLEGLKVAGHTGECPYGCPVCAAITIVKQMSPDVANHLAAAAREFVLAAKSFLDGVAERERDSTQPSPVQHIPLDS